MIRSTDDFVRREFDLHMNGIQELSRERPQFLQKISYEYNSKRNESVATISNLLKQVDQMKTERSELMNKLKTCRQNLDTRSLQAFTNLSLDDELFNNHSFIKNFEPLQNQVFSHIIIFLKKNI